MKTKLFSVVLSLAVLSSSSSVYAKEGQDWIIRSRAVYVKADVKSTVSTIGGNVHAGSDQVPELDFTRFFTPNIAAELILATTKHDIDLKGSSAGNIGLGSVKLLPPTLTIQYHTNPNGKIRPYAGAGLNYTFFYDTKTGGVNTIRYKDTFGYALQGGFDYMINDRFGLNFDIKKIFLKTDVKVDGAIKADVRLDPWLIGAGISYRF